MAPPPEYDKEPKAPDKSASNISFEETKALNNVVNDQQNISDSISASTSASAEAESKHVETLDDGALRALLDEAITYKCPKDREGKSSLFKELLEEVEQDEQACEAAARNLNVGRRQRGGARGGSGARHSVAQSNSLQDLVAALAGEPTPRRPHRHHNAPPVSARAHHGGSLPSGVDTSFLLGEEGSAPRGANYLATVRCVNPPPLSERRVSASDAPQDDTNRRSKPTYPMTYTARATLEIGSGGGSGTTRAVTTTTASNQVRTTLHLPPKPLLQSTAPIITQTTKIKLDNKTIKTHLSKQTQYKLKTNELRKVTEIQPRNNVLAPKITKSKSKISKNKHLKKPSPSKTTNAQSDIPNAEKLLVSQQGLEHKVYQSTQPTMRWQLKKQQQKIQPPEWAFSRQPRFQHPDYERAPTTGPPERMYNTACRYSKLYNHGGNSVCQYRGNKGAHEDEESDLFTRMKYEFDLIERTNFENKHFGKNVTEKTNVEKPVTNTQVKKVKVDLEEANSPQYILLRALIPKTNCDNDNSGGGGGGKEETNNNLVKTQIALKKENPRDFSSDKKRKQQSDKLKEYKAKLSSEAVGVKQKSKLSKVVVNNNNPKPVHKSMNSKDEISSYDSYIDPIADDDGELSDENVDQTGEEWSDNVKNWYRGLTTSMGCTNVHKSRNDPTVQEYKLDKLYSSQSNETKVPFITLKEMDYSENDPVKPYLQQSQPYCMNDDTYWAYNNMDTVENRVTNKRHFQNFRQRNNMQQFVKKHAVPEKNDWNPRNIRKMTIGKPLSEFKDFDSPSLKIEDQDDLPRSSTPVDNHVEVTTNTHDDDDVEFFDALENKVESKNSEDTYLSFCDELNKSMSEYNISGKDNIPMCFKTEMEQIKNENNIPICNETQIDKNGNENNQLVKDFIKTTEIGNTPNARQLIKGFQSKKNNSAEDVNQKYVANAVDMTSENVVNIKSVATVEDLSLEIANAITVMEDNNKSDDLAPISLNSVKGKGDSKTEDVSPESFDNAEHMYMDMPESIVKCVNHDAACPTALEAVKGNHNSLIFVDTSSFDKIGSCCVTNVADPDALPMSSKEQLDLNIGLKDIPNDEIGLKDLDTDNIELKNIPKDEINLKHIPKYLDAGDIELKDIPKEEIELKCIPKEEIELKGIPKQLDTDDITLKNVPNTTEEEGGIELVDMLRKIYQIDSKEIECSDDKTDSNEGTCSEYYAELVLKLIDSLKHSSVDKDNSDSFLGYKSEKVQNCDEEILTETNNIFLEDDDKYEVLIFYKNKLPVIVEIDEDSLKRMEDAANISKNEIHSHKSEELTEKKIFEENVDRAKAKHENCKTIKEKPKCDMQIKNKVDFESGSDQENSAVNTINDGIENNDASNASEPKNLTDITLNRPMQFMPVDTSSSGIEIENAATENETPTKINAENNEKEGHTLDRNVLRDIVLYRHFYDTPVDFLPEVDSAIPFSCITTPKVVASCNTTSSSTQAATAAVDSKRAKLEWWYRAVSSVVAGRAPQPDAAAAVAASSSTAALLQPRSVLSNSFNGLPLARPSYGTMSATTEEYKKPLDENGNSMHAFSTPLLAAPTQHKKPRRKKSSKNEVVITSHQIDGYQGNKDLNEVLRFIESNADAPRGNAAKLRKTRHEDEDKPKKRERRKDKQPPQRAASLEEIAVSSLRELTASRPPPAKPERRSWGDDFRPEDEGSPGEFQTVTKKRRWRRRETRAAPAPPAARPRRVSAPPSDRSDSNDDDSLHSLHSLPALNAGESARAPAASYADIARAANIPDLIESCNYYTEDPRPAPPAPQRDDYPALEPRRRVSSGVTATPKPPPLLHTPHSNTAAQRRDKKRTEAASACAEKDSPERGCPAPDVVSEGRPPVVLLDSPRHTDMDGITFGFDINHQLLTDGSRRRGCDLVCDAVEGAADTNECDPEHTAADAADEQPPAPASPAPAPPAESTPRAGDVCKAITTVRYLPPAYTPLTPHLVQIIDYVAQAWDEVVRCGGGGKVRYFSE